ncbi:hypothetical protein J6590_077369 [Homalodisca vitripennis]|nr:hypothetical protein J6590_077369 [Homalodisca vitripennis]
MLCLEQVAKPIDDHLTHVVPQIPDQRTSTLEQIGNGATDISMQPFCLTHAVPQISIATHIYLRTDWEWCHRHFKSQLQRTSTLEQIGNGATDISSDYECFHVSAALLPNSCCAADLNCNALITNVSTLVQPFYLTHAVPQISIATHIYLRTDWEWCHRHFKSQLQRTSTLEQIGNGATDISSDYECFTLVQPFSNSCCAADLMQRTSTLEIGNGATDISSDYECFHNRLGMVPQTFQVITNVSTLVQPFYLTHAVPQISIATHIYLRTDWEWCHRHFKSQLQRTSTLEQIGNGATGISSDYECFHVSAALLPNCLPPVVAVMYTNTT